MVGGQLEQLLQPHQGLSVLIQDGEHPPPVGKDQVPIGQGDGGGVGAEVDRVALQLPGHHVPAGAKVWDLKVVANGLDMVGDTRGLWAYDCGNTQTQQVANCKIF